MLIDPNVATREKLGTLLSDLHTHKTRDGARLRCRDLTSKEDHEQATVSITDLKSALAKVFPDETAYIIVTAANNDGLRGVDSKSPRSMSISDELDNVAATWGLHSRLALFARIFALARVGQDACQIMGFTMGPDHQRMTDVFSIRADQCQ